MCLTNHCCPRGAVSHGHTVTLVPLDPAELQRRPPLYLAGKFDGVAWASDPRSPHPYVDLHQNIQREPIPCGRTRQFANIGGVVDNDHDASPVGDVQKGAGLLPPDDLIGDEDVFYAKACHHRCFPYGCGTYAHRPRTHLETGDMRALVCLHMRAKRFPTSTHDIGHVRDIPLESHLLKK